MNCDRGIDTAAASVLHSLVEAPLATEHSLAVAADSVHIELQQLELDSRSTTRATAATARVSRAASISSTQ